MALVRQSQARRPTNTSTCSTLSCARLDSSIFLSKTSQRRVQGSNTDNLHLRRQHAIAVSKPVDYESVSFPSAYDLLIFMGVVVQHEWRYSHREGVINEIVDSVI
jgi:hypothetical protein